MSLLRRFTMLFDRHNVDASGRLRTTTASPVFEARFNYGENGRVFTSLVENGGTIVHNQFGRHFTLSTTTASASRARRISTQYIPQPLGRNMTMEMGVRFAPQKENVLSRVGMFDEGDGIFFERTSQGMFVVLRSSVSGVAVDQRIAQANWNLDKFDGTGPSRIIVDWDKAQMVGITTAAAGTIVYIGLILEDRLYCAHSFRAVNVYDGPLFSVTSIPAQYELRNVGTAASATTMAAGSVIAQIEGHFSYDASDMSRFVVTTGNSAIPISQSAFTPVLGMRLGLNKNGRRYRGHIIPEGIEVTVLGSHNVRFNQVLNATLVNANFAQHNPMSALEVEGGGNAPLSTGFSYSGGIVASSGFFNSGTSKFDSNTAQRDGVQYPMLSGRPDQLQLVILMTMQSLGSNTSVFAAINYFETGD